MKTCRCLAKIKRALVKELGDDAGVEVDTSFRSTHRIKKESFAGLRYSHKERRPSGAIMRRRVIGHLIFNFCPFCGERIQ